MDTVIVKIVLRTDIDLSVLLDIAYEHANELSSDVKSYGSKCEVLDDDISVEMVKSDAKGARHP